jgi:hypothetical protein
MKFQSNSSNGNRFISEMLQPGDPSPDHSTVNVGQPTGSRCSPGRRLGYTAADANGIKKCGGAEGKDGPGVSSQEICLFLIAFVVGRLGECVCHSNPLSRASFIDVHLSLPPKCMPLILLPVISTDAVRRRSEGADENMRVNGPIEIRIKSFRTMNLNCTTKGSFHCLGPSMPINRFDNRKF